MRALPLLMSALLLAMMLAPAVQADAAAVDRARFVVSFDELPAGLHAGSPLLDGHVVRVDEALGFAVVDGSPAAAGMPLSPHVLSVEPDAPQTWVQMLPDDPQWGEQYGPEQVRAPEAWDVTQGSVDATVCVVDTGVRYTHEDLAGARWLGGYDVVNGDDDPMDDQGHGTHVAGTVAATTGNGVGVAGVAQVGLYGVKVLDENGSGASADVATGVRWCADEGADVISLSLGGTGSSALRKAVKYAWDQGSLVVAAAGNSGPCSECVSFPAAYPQALAVTCTTPEEAQCKFSSEGRQADIAAPGSKILSTYVESDSSYKALSGTSMSTPHVSGVAALVWSHYPDLTNKQVRDVLESSARDIGSDGWDEQTGWGIVDAKAALDAAANLTAPAPDPAPEPDRDPVPQPGGPNAPPVADAGIDQVVRVPRGFDFSLAVLDGRRSSDPDGRIVSFEWTEGGKTLGMGDRLPVVLDVGVHDLRLTVRDKEGASATDEVRVEVTEDSSAETRFIASSEGLSSRFDAAGSGDAGGALFLWEFGDGAKGFGPAVTHEYAAPGTYEVKLTTWGVRGDTTVTRTLFVAA